MFKNKILTLSILLVISMVTFAQDGKNQLDLSLFPYYNLAVLQTCDGGGGLDNSPGFRFGLQYNFKLSENKWFNTGILVSTSTHTYTGAVIDPAEPVLKKEQSAVIIQFPLRLKYELNSKIYLKPGFTIDIQTQKDSDWYGSLQNGIGLSLAAGYIIDLQKNWHLGIEPEMSFLSMIQLPLGKRDNCH